MFRLTGPVRVETAVGELEIQPPAVRTLLAALLLERRTHVRWVDLLDYLWDVPPPSAQTNLRGYVYALRRQLGSVDPRLKQLVSTVRGQRGGYAIQVQDDVVDVAMFTTLARSGSEHLRAARCDTAVKELESALMLWGGPAGQGCAGSAALASRFAALDDLHLMARERLAEARLMQGRTTELIPELTELLARSPHREGVWNLLMRASYLGGDVAGAVDMWRKAVSALSDDLGLDPSDELAKLHRSILMRDDEAVRALQPRPALEREHRAIASKAAARAVSEQDCRAR